MAESMIGSKDESTPPNNGLYNKLVRNVRIETDFLPA